MRFVIGWDGVISTALLEEGAVTAGTVSKVLTMLPIGVTVAMGSVCILDTAPTIGGTATVGRTCVLVPASTGDTAVGTVFCTDVLSSPVCIRPCARAAEGAAIPTAAGGGSMTGPGVVTETTCLAGREDCKAGVCATTEAAAVQRVVEMDGLATTGKDDRGAANLDKCCATAGEMVDGHSARVGVPADNLIVASAEPTAGALDATVDTKACTLPNLGGDETRVGVPTLGEAKLPACAASNLGRADTTFVLLGNTAEPTAGAPVSRTGATLGVVAGNDGPTAGVHATKGQLTAGTLGNRTVDWGKTGACGATVTWLAPCGGTDAPVLVTLAAGTCCGAGLEMIRTWLPGPRPWGGTTKRALLRRICVPAARGVRVLMTILCWIEPAPVVVVNWVLVVVAEEMDVWDLLTASREKDGKKGVSSPTPPWSFEG